MGRLVYKLLVGVKIRIGFPDVEIRERVPEATHSRHPSMTDSHNTEPDNKLPFSRRDLLKVAGGAGAIGSFGVETAAAKKPKRRVIGIEPGRARNVQKDLPANQTIKTLDFGDIGQAIVGRWPDRALQGLERNPNVRYIHEDRKLSLEGHDPTTDLDWSRERIGADVAHAFGHMGDGIDVSIVDTGIDSQHDDLEDNLGEGNAIQSCSGTCPEDWHDDNGHGTSVAGIVGAVHTDSDEPGVAPEVTLHAVKVGGGDAFESDVAEGLEWTADQNYDVANMSLGREEEDLPDDGDVMEDGMQYAIDRGVVLVSSAGNESNLFCGSTEGDVTFPGGFDQDIAVSAITSEDELAGYSSVGPEVDIAGPSGPQVCSGAPNQTGDFPRTTNLGGGTTGFSGTSCAAPHVAAAAALLRADGVDPGDVQGQLESTAEDLGLDSTRQGAGLVDIDAALDLPKPTAAFEWDPDVPDEGEPVEFDASASHVDEIAIDEYEWDFGDGGTATTSDPIIEHTYSDWGEFNVTLTVTDEAGQTDDKTQQVRVNAIPEAAFEWMPTLPNEGDDIEFNAGDSVDPDGNIVQYEWDFGDGDTDTGEVVTHNYGPAGEDNWGEFDVTLTVTDDDDATDDVTETVRVNAYPVAEPFDILVGGEFMDPTTNPVVRDEPVEFDASDSFDPDPDPFGGIAEYAWDFGDGTTSTGETVTHTYVEGGEKTVELTVTDDDGASHEEISVHEETFTVNIRVDIEIKPNDDNDINPRRPGEVPVAVHHTVDFDSPAELNPSTVQFGNPETVNDGGGATPTHNGGHIEDVDEDGDADWIGHFPVRDTGFDRGDDEGKLFGETTDNPPVPVFGFDDVRTVGRN